ncbi:hypothetical protein [Pedobacter polysacchareus]|uniref:hypothetical protein n=1 Tax=Pedobacter polysacchareus TaxID=2861973 RepID=UPI001C99501D|nr:hypothetical protein [Pedobacter polysacchareus]
MKENFFIMDSDGVCIYVTIGINADLPAKLILGSLNLILLGVIVLAVSKGVVALMIFSTLCAILLIRFSFWNIYGKEHLVINTKTMMYQHDYGFFRTNPKLKFFQKGLSVIGKEATKAGSNAQILMIFQTYNHYDLPEDVYQTALPIAKRNADLLIKAINSLFIEKITEDYSLPPIFMN